MNHFDQCDYDSEESINCITDNLRANNYSSYLKIQECFSFNSSNLQEVIDGMIIEFDENQPSLVYLDQYYYSGKKSRKDFVDKICSSFEKSPPNCMFINNQYSSDPNYAKKTKTKLKNKKWFIFLNIFVLLLMLFFASVLLYIIYQKIYQHILRERVEKIVKETVVSHYASINVSQITEPQNKED